MISEDKLADELASLRIDRSQKGALGSGSRTPRSNDPSSPSGSRYDRPRRTGLIVTLVLLPLLAVAGYFLFVDGRGRVFPDEVQLGSVTLVSPAQEEVTLVATGYVYAKKRATVAPKTTGRLARLLVDEGDKVKADQLIAELESSDAQAQVAQLRADILASQAKVEQARANLTDSETKLTRETALHAKEAGTQASFDDASARSSVSKAELGAAEAELHAVQARQQAAAVTVENTKVRAPFAGTVLRKLSEVGEVLSPAIPGSSIGVVIIATLDDLEVQADVSESQFAKVKLGTPAEIILDAFPDRRFAGKVSEIRPTVDRSKASVTVKVKFVDSSDGVLPDMAAKVSFLSHALGADQLKAAPKLVVPADAVVQRSGHSVVFAFNEGTVREMAVSVVGPLSSGGMVEISPAPSLSMSAPVSGTRVVLHPSAELADGRSVKEKK